MNRLLPMHAARTVAVVLLLSAMGIHAQDYPTKPIRMIVSVPPGGAVDTVARMMGQRMAESLKQAIIIENRPGGNSIIAAEAAARSVGDGYTLFMALDITMTMNPHLYPTLPYDPVKDFAPISLVNTNTLLVVANPRVPFKSVAELVSYAKSNPGKVNYGAGTSLGQIAGALFKSSTGTDVVHVPFKAADPAVQALIRGDIDVVFGSFASSLNHVRQGRLIAIATTGTDRSKTLPNVPTMKEVGYPAIEVTGWTALYAPMGAPAPIIDRLNREVVRIIGTPEVADKMRAAISSEPASSTPSELAAMQKTDTAKWQTLVKLAGIKAD